MRPNFWGWAIQKRRRSAMGGCPATRARIWPVSKKCLKRIARPRATCGDHQELGLQDKLPQGRAAQAGGNDPEPAHEAAGHHAQGQRLRLGEERVFALCKLP